MSTEAHNTGGHNSGGDYTSRGNTGATNTGRGSTAGANTGRTDHDGDSLLQKAAKIVGAVFVLVGILGFIPGITSNFDTFGLAGNGSNAKLLGLFQVSALHNIVHLLFGVAGLVMAKTWSGARTFLIGGGIIYLVLFLYGLIVDRESSANFVPMNVADNWLHLLLGLGMIALGVLLSRARDNARTNTY